MDEPADARLPRGTYQTEPPLLPLAIRARPFLPVGLLYRATLMNGRTRELLPAGMNRIDVPFHARLFSGTLVRVRGLADSLGRSDTIRRALQYLAVAKHTLAPFEACGPDVIALAITTADRPAVLPAAVDVEYRVRRAERRERPPGAPFDMPPTWRVETRRLTLLLSLPEGPLLTPEQLRNAVAKSGEVRAWLGRDVVEEVRLDYPRVPGYADWKSP